MIRVRVRAKSNRKMELVSMCSRALQNCPSEQSAVLMPIGGEYVVAVTRIQNSTSRVFTSKCYVVKTTSTLRLFLHSTNHLRASSLRSYPFISESRAAQKRSEYPDLQVTAVHSNNTVQTTYQFLWLHYNYKKLRGALRLHPAVEHKLYCGTS